jgi:hypothetical protein
MYFLVFEGGGKGGACHKCGEEGHFVRECPKALADGEYEKWLTFFFFFLRTFSVDI